MSVTLYESAAAARATTALRNERGEKAFTGYLGPNHDTWAEHDACELLRTRGPLPLQLLVDQGQDDKFLAEQLKPELLEAAAEATGQRLTLRRHVGYDHSYWFIQTFMADHIVHHAQALEVA